MAPASGRKRAGTRAPLGDLLTLARRDDARRIGHALDRSRT
jgi:hypothetical protein